MGAMGPTQVGVVTMQPEGAPITTVLPGRIIASATAEVRPQVGGIVTAVSVREGQQVEQGDVIATVDPATYEADVAVAEASLASAQAQLPTAQAKVDRYEALLGSGGISRAESDTAKVELAQAQAAVTSAEAQVRIATMTLERSTIVAPISGIVGTVNVQVGSLLTANQADPLTIVRQVDPVEITLVESSSNLLTSRAATQIDISPASAEAPVEPPRLAVTLTLEDGSTYDQEGSVASMDMVVNETTGTFTLRASMPNPQRLLLPGMFVRASIHFGEEPNVYLVPQRAVTFNGNGQPSAFFVGEDNKAVQRVLTAERAINNAWVVTAGIEPGDQLIVDGLQKIREGGEVEPLEVTIENNGVVYQDAPKAMPFGGATPEGGVPQGIMPGGAAPPDGMSPPTDASAPDLGSAPAADQPNIQPEGN